MNPDHAEGLACMDKVTPVYVFTETQAMVSVTPKGVPAWICKHILDVCQVIMWAGQDEAVVLVNRLI